MNPIKPNFLACVVGLLAVGLMSLWLYARVTTLLAALSAAETVGEAQQAAVALLSHIIGGGSILVPVVSGLVAWGIKLLDEHPEPGATVPADVHQGVVEMLLADARTTADAERLAHDVERNR